MIIKKIAIAFGAVFFCCMALKAENIHVETAGTLRDLVGDKLTTLTELTLSGYVDETDIACIREMTLLSILDMKQCTIVTKDVSTSVVTTVTWLWGNMFEGMDAIQKIIIPDNILSISAYSFARCKVQSVILPEGLKTLADHSFQQAYELTAIHIPSTVSMINKYSFAGCYNLREITFEANSQLEAIGERGFSGTKITTIELPTTVTSLGTSCFRECEELVSITIPPLVTTIEKYAFNKCSNLVNIALPEGLETIERGVFGECLKLSDIKLPSTLTAIGDTIASYTYDGAFYNSAIKSIVIPEKVTMLGAVTFSACYGLESVALPDNLTFLANTLFQSCRSLLTVNLPKALTVIGDEVFSGCTAWDEPLVIPEGVSDIGYKAFSSCNSIPSVVLPEGLKTIGAEAFWNCFKIEKCNIPSTVSSIGYRAFYCCYALSSPIVIPDGITVIKSGTFQSCKLIPSIKLPDTLTEIEESALSGCASLTTLQLPDNLTTIGNNAFSNCSNLNCPIAIPESMQIVPEGLFSGCKSLLDVRIPPEVREIGRNVFKDCMSLVQIKLPDSLRIIGYSAFENCIKLRKIELPEKLNTIDGRAFFNTSQLKSIHIPDSVAVLGNQAFGNCINLKSIIYDAKVDIPDNSVFGFTIFGYKYYDNILLYLSSDAIKVPETWKKVQVIRNGEIESVEFVDSVSIHIARPFKTKRISYSRKFTMESGLHTSAGWQSIVLPFTASRIMHESKGELAPFGSDITGAKPFWLRELTSEGYTVSSILEANKPYIISMPNNSGYEEDYNITGTVTFSAEDPSGVEIPATPEIKLTGETSEYKLIPTYQTVNANDTVYALNSSVYNENPAGSAFVRNLRAVIPFEAYVVSKESRSFAPAMYSIGGGATALEKILLKEESTLKIYSQRRTLYIESDKPRSIQLYGTDGVLVRSLSVGEGKNTIDNLPCGIYFLEGRKVILRD